ncbi:MAG: DUF4981 domain-containing protein [Saccharofermentans sp.]|nr:DUF4981 domain-containing protein [Saccharofermentans sp.]
MEFTYSNDGFLPYDSFDYIYNDRVMPEFGKVASPYLRPLTTWRFYHANGVTEIPFGVELRSFDDTEWDIVNCPSTWQTEGYGLPQNLLYEYPERLNDNTARHEDTISDKYVRNSTNSDSDETGIYRTTVIFSAQELERAIYLETSGICGSFKIYVNDQLLCESHSITTRKRLLISDVAVAGINQIVIIVNRFDRDENGHVILDIMNYGFAGLFRPIMLVEDSLLELSNLHLNLEYVPEAYITEIAKISSLSERGKASRVPHGDFLIKVDFSIRNHTNFMLPYSVRISLLEARAEYDPYKLPYVSLKNQSNDLAGVVDAQKEVRVQNEFVALDVAEWSDCTPVQYDIVLEVLDSEGRIVCAKKKRFGFRTVQIVQGKLNINDRRINLTLVKYYEFDPKGGIAVPQDRMRQDIILMKRAGINGVIADGFPLSDEFLNLCDQYGIYVIATAADFQMRDYVESAMNHPSIVMWGFQDYNFNSEKAVRVKHECMLIDDTRPWYCAADRKQRKGKGKEQESVSDLLPFPNEAGAVFGPWVDLCLDRKKIFTLNKSGRNLFETIPGRTRFTDDDTMYKWIHHADLVGGKQKENSCIGQGIVDSERSPHPIYLDIKRQCQTIAVFASVSDPASLTMRNMSPFAYTEELDLVWQLLLGGKSIASGKGTIGEIEPYGSRTLKFPFAKELFTNAGWSQGRTDLISIYDEAMTKELVFDITMQLHNDTYYAKAGYEIAFYQDVIVDEVASPVAMRKNADVKELTDGENDVAALPSGIDESAQSNVLQVPDEQGSEDKDGIVERFDPEKAIAVPAEEELPLKLINETTISSDPKRLYVNSEKTRIGFSKDPAGCSVLSVNGFNFLKGTMRPSFYRCPSNIDRTDRSFILAKTVFSKESDYEQIQESIRYIGSEYGKKDGCFSMISRFKSFAMSGEVLMFYEVPSPDKLRVTLQFTPKYDMVRYGIRFPIVPEGAKCTWYGRGPGESYADRKNAARIGVFSAETGKIYHPYARPAENSSHTDTRVVRLTNEAGDSITIRRLTSTPKFDFTVLPYTPEQMNEYLHEEQLMHNDYCEFFCDFGMKEIERTADNVSLQPIKKGVNYRETFEFTLKGAGD